MIENSPESIFIKEGLFVKSKAKSSIAEKAGKEVKIVSGAKLIKDLKYKSPGETGGLTLVDYSLTTLTALGPFEPSSSSKLTESPSKRDLNPLPAMDE